MQVLETERLVVRWLVVEDAPFILELVNEPAWRQFIGGRGVKTLDEARDYISRGPVEMVARLGFGLYLVASKAEGLPLGICGLIKRDGLEDVDIGFAFLSRYQGQGYAFESAAAVLDYGNRTLGLRRIVAITSPDNLRSLRLLERLGLKPAGLIQLSEKGPESALLARDF